MLKKTAEIVLGIAKGTVEYGEQMVECTVKYGERTEYRERTEECTVEYRELTRHRTEYGEGTN